MRRIALCATMALLIVCATATAGPPTTVTVDSHVTPVIRKFQAKTTPSTLAINLKFSTATGEPSSALTKAVLNFTYGAKLNGNLFPSCSADMIRNHKACPKGSLIGTGTGLGALADAQEPITLQLYNGPGGKSITFRIKGERPAVIDVPFDAPLQTFNSGLYNYRLTVAVPDILQRIAGVEVSLDHLDVKVNGKRKVKGKMRGYIETLICPPGALVVIGSTFSFLEAPDYTTNGYIHCG
jgi:hypothetical protein